MVSAHNAHIRFVCIVALIHLLSFHAIQLTGDIPEKLCECHAYYTDARTGGD